MALLTVDKLCKTYGAFRMTDISLSLNRGQILCLLGPSGCGKTTLLRLVAGLEAPDAGAIYLENQKVDPIPVHKRQIGLMFQDLALFPHKSVFENVAYGLRMQKQSRPIVREKTEKMLSIVGLSRMAQRHVGDLSGGEQQRVALARSLAPQPRLLMLDEPLGALDRSLREHLLQEIRSILKKLEVTAIFVTHDQSEALNMGDIVGIMDQGRLLQLDAPQALYMKPSHPFVARFLGFQNLIPGTVATDASIDTDIGMLNHIDHSRTPGESVTIVVRPETVKWHIDAPGSHRYYRISGWVQYRAFSGRHYRVTLTVNQQQTLTFDLPNTDPPPDVGRKMVVWIDIERLILI